LLCDKRGAANCAIVVNGASLRVDEGISTMTLARAALTLLLLSAVPADAADVAQGKTIAQRWCAACHVVAPDQTQASVDVPTFRDIAQRKSGEQIKIFLIDPHPKMPDMSLSRAEIADIVGYIESLKP